MNNKLINKEETEILRIRIQHENVGILSKTFCGIRIGKVRKEKFHLVVEVPINNGFIIRWRCSGAAVVSGQHLEKKK